MTPPTRRSRSHDEGPIRSVKEFVRRYFPNAKECPHCGGTGIAPGSDTTIDRIKWREDRERDRATTGGIR